MTSNSDSPNSTALWRFWVPLVFQTALILAVPAQAIYTQLRGKTVILQTVPVDPYELPRGYSQTLRYDISSQDNLRKLPGWQELPKQQPNGNKLTFTFIKPGTQFYVILAAPAKPTLAELPQPWEPVAVSIKLPSQLPANQVVLKGIAEYGSIQYGLETYYIPEDQREEINADLRAAQKADSTQSQLLSPPPNSSQRPKKPSVVMEIKVNTEGDAVPISLWARVGEAPKQQVRNYRF
jgi:uncharacterized membrane-anchored protein